MLRCSAVSFFKLADILNKLRGQNPALSKRMEEADALSHWEEAVGAQIAKHARAIRVQDEVLWIEVDHPIWKTELHYRKRQILDQLNKGRKTVVQDLLLLDGRSRKE
jgi:predicted nucleic acid-binding Zn ribbon protein